jgi:hypothetical protein
MKKLPQLAAILAVTFSAAATAGAQLSSSACGDENVSFKVKNTMGAPASAPPPGMANLVFIEDQLQARPGNGGCLKCATTVRLGMDGKWIAATHGFSHATVSIPAGEHHFCAVMNEPIVNPDALPAHASLHVEAGHTYYLRGRISLFASYGVAVLDLTAIDPDEGAYLGSVTAESNFTPEVHQKHN